MACFCRGQDFHGDGASQVGRLYDQGWLVDTVVTQDSTDYKCKDGEAISNLHEKVSFKVRSASKPSVNVGDSVLPVNPECSVYGEYRNQLSVRCDDVTIVPATGKDKV